MRINDIVKTLTAYQSLQAGLTGRAVEGSGKSSTDLSSLGLDFDQAALDQQAAEADSLELSGAQPDWSASEEADDSLGAIVESFVRQRQTYAFTVPGIGGYTSPISVTWEVEEAYRVIEFVPRSGGLDVQG